MKMDEALRRDLVDAWEQAEDVDEALLNIQGVIDRFNTTLPIEEREWGGTSDLNIYYNPQNCGLELVGTAEEEPEYNFHIVLLLRDVLSGRFFMAEDAGCSCPIPFENHRGVSKLTEVQDISQAISFLNHCESNRGWGDEGASMRRAIRDNLPRW